MYCDMDSRFPGYGTVFHDAAVRPIFACLVEVLGAAVGHPAVNAAGDPHGHTAVEGTDGDPEAQSMLILQGNKALELQLHLESCGALPVYMAVYHTVFQV